MDLLRYIKYGIDHTLTEYIKIQVHDRIVGFINWCTLSFMPG